MYKDEIEVAAMQKAAVIAEQALAAVIAEIRIGMSELEIAGMLVQALLQIRQRRANSPSSRSSLPGQTGPTRTPSPPSADWPAAICW